MAYTTPTETDVDEFIPTHSDFWFRFCLNLGGFLCHGFGRKGGGNRIFRFVQQGEGERCETIGFRIEIVVMVGAKNQLLLDHEQGAGPTQTNEFAGFQLFLNFLYGMLDGGVGLLKTEVAGFLVGLSQQAIVEFEAWVEADFFGGRVKKPGSRFDMCGDLVLYEAAQPGHNDAVVLGQEVFEVLNEVFHRIIAC